MNPNPFYLANRLPPSVFRSVGAGVDFAGDEGPVFPVSFVDCQDGACAPFGGFGAAYDEDEAAFGVAPIVMALVSLVPVLFDGIGKAVEAGQRKKLERMKAAGGKPGAKPKKGAKAADGFLSAAEGFFKAFQADPGRARAAFESLFARSGSPASSPLQLSGDFQMNGAFLGNDGNWYQPLLPVGDIDRDGVANIFDPLPGLPAMFTPGGAMLSRLLPGAGGQGGGQGGGRQGGRPVRLPPGVIRALQALKGKPAMKQAAARYLQSMGIDIGEDFGFDFDGGFGGDDFGADGEGIGAVIEGEDIAADLDGIGDDFGAAGDADFSARLGKLEASIVRADAAIARLTGLVGRVSASTSGQLRATLAKLAASAARAKARRRGVGQGGAVGLTAGEPTTARLSKLPMLAGGIAASPRNAFTIPVGGTAAAVALLNEDQPYLDLQVVGLTAKSFTTSAGNSEGMVEDFKLTGGTNLFIHEGPTQAADYDTDLENLANLRAKPEFTSPSRLSLSVFAIGNQNEIVTVSAKAICKVLRDKTYGTRNRMSHI